MLEFQDLLRAADQAPCVAALGLKVVELERGWCKLTAKHDPRFNGLHPGWHGGMLAAVADSVAWYAIATHTGADEPLVSTDLHIRYLNPCLTDAIATARLIKLGKTLCPVSVELLDMEHKPVALATVTYMRLERK